MTRGKTGLKFIGSLITVYLLIFVMGHHGTSAWFIGETEARGYIGNAKTEDVLSITSEVISYDMDETVAINIDIKNKSEVEVPIEFEGLKASLSPGESFSELFHEKVSSEVTEINFQLTGFNHYISELITIPLNTKLILENKVGIEKEDIEVNEFELPETKMKSEKDDKNAEVTERDYKVEIED